ncbi:methyl-accepting chemotaxis protein [Rhodovibrionaceae bacterium A322]
MKSLKIQTQIFSIALLALLGFALTTGIYLYGNQKLEKSFIQEIEASEAAILSSKIKYLFLNARRNEKDFLLRLDNKYVEKHSLTSAQVIQSLEELKHLTNSEETTALIDQIESTYQDYQKQFTVVQEDWLLLGLSPKEGLRGSLRGAVHKVESKLKEFDQPRMAVTMLMMRRHEKDFLMRKDPKYVDRMVKRRQEFSEQLAASSLPDADKAEITQLMSQYHADFNKLAKVYLELIPETKELSRLFAVGEPLLDSYFDQVQQNEKVAKAAAFQTQSESTFIMIAALIAIGLVVTVCALLIGRGLSRPITSMVSIMQRLAKNDFSADIPAQRRSNEIGDMARALVVFKETAEQVRDLDRQREEEKTRADQEKRQSLLDMANSFEASVGHIVRDVSNTATDFEASAQNLVATAQTTDNQTSAASDASTEATSNVQNVATAAEQLTGSITEISSQVVQSTTITATAVEKTRTTADTVKGLAEAAERIGDVVTLIQDIAEQTNLLALNATIEAARAGEAGKGFAVVASEVKSLANQTAKATSQISDHIKSIQGETLDAVDAIGEIQSVITEVNDIAESIAAAVEEQSAATSEISNNVQQAAKGTEEVASNITLVAQGSAVTRESATTMLMASGDLVSNSDRLHRQVEEFLSNIRAA